MCVCVCVCVCVAQSLSIVSSDKVRLKGGNRGGKRRNEGSNSS